MLTPNDSLVHPKKQVTTRLQYQTIYRAWRWYFRMKNFDNMSDEMLSDFRHFIWTLAPQIADDAWRSLFMKQAAEITGIGQWHGWHNARRLKQWRDAYPDWEDVLFPIPF